MTLNIDVSLMLICLCKTLFVSAIHKYHFNNACKIGKRVYEYLQIVITEGDANALSPKKPQTESCTFVSVVLIASV